MKKYTRYDGVGVLNKKIILNKKQKKTNKQKNIKNFFLNKKN